MRFRSSFSDCPGFSTNIQGPQHPSLRCHIGFLSLNNMSAILLALLVPHTVSEWGVQNTSVSIWLNNARLLVRACHFANVLCFWHLADISSCTANVRFRGSSGDMTFCIAKCPLMIQSGHEDHFCCSAGAGEKSISFAGSSTTSAAEQCGDGRSK